MGALVLAHALAACGGRTAGSTSGDAGAPDGPSSSSGTVSSDASGASASPPSCARGGPGLTDCGASRESCCTSLEVSGGTFDRTYSNDGGGPNGEGDPATVSSFRLDKYLVTVGRFRRFVDAWNGSAGYRPPAGSGKHTHLNGGNGLANSATPGTYETGWVASDDGRVAPTDANLTTACVDAATFGATWTPSAEDQENLPINCVSWWEAYAFCIWDGGFLPSEAEWEYAAAGGSQEREYPWGSADPGAGNQYAIYGCDQPNGSGSCTGVTNIAPVGAATRGAGAWGQLDLAGNLWEWNLDTYANYVDPCTDCAYLTAPSDAVTRGGLFDGPLSYLPASSRQGGSIPSIRIYGIGFRCSRAP
jgi:sulfatase modifying factor 1